MPLGVIGSEGMVTKNSGIINEVRWSASERFSALMDGKIESQQVVYAEGFTAPDLAAYLPSGTAEK